MSLYQVQKFLYQLNRDERVQQRFREDPEGLLDDYELDAEEQATVSEVIPRSPAAKLRLRKGDRLVKKGKLAADQPVYLYCSSGARSGRAAGILRKKGFDQAWNVGGLRGLKASGAEVGR